MKTINPKCTNEKSFEYSILISLHYYDLKSHKKDKINQISTLIITTLIQIIIIHLRIIILPFL